MGTLTHVPLLQQMMVVGLPPKLVAGQRGDSMYDAPEVGFLVGNLCMPVDSAPRGRLPKDMNRRERMERKLLTGKWLAVYRRRGQAAEAPFGHIKGALGGDRFSLRGLGLVTGEWILTCAVHNLRKLFLSGSALPA